MRGSNTAVFVFLLLLVAIGALGQAAGFWQGITPYLIDRSGPGGLNVNFGVNLVSEAVAILTQVLVAFLVFDFLANQRERAYHAEGRRRFAAGVAKVFGECAENIAGLAGILPGMGSERRSMKELRFSDLLHYYDRALDPFEESEARDVNQLFDKIVFEHDSSGRAGFVRSITKLIKKMMPERPLPRLARFLRLLRKKPEWQVTLDAAVAAVDKFIQKRLADSATPAVTPAQLSA